MVWHVSSEKEASLTISEKIYISGVIRRIMRFLMLHFLLIFAAISAQELKGEGLVDRRSYLKVTFALNCNCAAFFTFAFEAQREARF